MRKLLLVVLFVLMVVTVAAADTIYLRDGRQLRGTLLGFQNGRFVFRVEPRYATTPSESNVARNRTNEGDVQYFRAEDVDRIEIEGRSLDEARYQTRNVQVTLDSNWIDSGVFVRRGERVQVSATGVITVGRMRITPDGARSTDPSAPLPNAPEGKLIGAIGNDSSAPIMELGSNREFTADRNGRLFLTANRGSYTDARGSFDVQIRRERNLNARETDDFDQGPSTRTRDRNPIDRNTDRNRGPREMTIDVPGSSRGTDSGFEVRSGDQITITASGTITAGSRVGQVGPEGARSTGFGINARPLPTAG